MGSNLFHWFKGSPPAAACRASGGRWPRCGLGAGRGQRRHALLAAEEQPHLAQA